MSHTAYLTSLLCALTVAGCAVDSGSLDRARQNFGTADPRPEAFYTCGSHNCSKRIAVSLSPQEWAKARAPLIRRAPSAGAERRALAEALRRLEVMVGAKTGYNSDLAYSTLQLAGKAQDCVDEMVNTAVYLALLDDAGLLRFHRPGQRVTIGFMTRRFWTHTVASIVQQDTGQEFIVETWAVDHGKTPYIMDRTDWASNAPLRRDF
ncbi:hypothetical protein [Antarctobacter heliothermus]|uniref:Uncharacterized protein n=1 Tax=Antarctobacter heliothermus TaxID=74033 RepID=A0A239LMG0_9RHOB|nr:hypothetical protein [Antarctobacter heliothermus]SNT31003.1 hypothetical protein SAMN04488078_10948 [Antarctobacter heliothermus]